MCLLVACEPYAIPNADDLHQGACSNPHGFGFAIMADDKIISERSMSAKKSIARFLELREQYPHGYAIWHARYATHGVKNEENCHPFKVGGSDLTYLAHNGILDVTIAHKDRRSDSRVFAEDILPLMGGVKALDNETTWNMLEGWAKGSKVAVLTLDPDAMYPFYLINEDLGTWDNEGIWWSNSSHKKIKYLPPLVIHDTKLDDYDYKLDDSLFDTTEVLDICPLCEEVTDLDTDPYYCMTCELCFDCGAHKIDCLCFMPRTYRYDKEFDMHY